MQVGLIAERYMTHKSPGRREGGGKGVCAACGVWGPYATTLTYDRGLGSSSYDTYTKVWVYVLNIL